MLFYYLYTFTKSIIRQILSYKEIFSFYFRGIYKYFAVKDFEKKRKIFSSFFVLL